MARRNHFHQFPQTAANCCQSKQFFLQQEHIFLSNRSIRLVETIFLSAGNSVVIFRVFLCQWKLLSKFQGGQFFKMNHILVSGQQFFNFLRESLKRKQLFCMMETHFSNKSFIRLVKTDFPSSANRLVSNFSKAIKKNNKCKY